MTMAFEVIHTERVYQGRVFDIRKDQVRLPDGKLINLDIVDHRSSITLLPIDSQGMVWFVRQYRHPAGLDLLELPAGVMEVGETPEQTAQREAMEEIGMAAGRLQKLGEFFLAAGYSTEYMYAFLATDLHPQALPTDEDEFLSIEKIPLPEALHMAETGQIPDAKTLATFLLARPHFLS
jgi:ADP-ribose pyrophosphatase